MRFKVDSHIPLEDIIKYLTGDFSDDVRVKVFDWLSQDEGNEIILKQMDKLFNTSLLNDKNKTSAFKKLCQKIENIERA